MTVVDKKVLEQLWGSHPAHIFPFDHLYRNLLDHVDKRNLTRIVEQDLELFNYTIHAQFNAEWDVFTLMSRGLILAPLEKKIVATPFPKFFNYGEVRTEGVDYYNGETIVTKKYDGSLGIVFCHKETWQVATRGSFKSEQAIWATQWLQKNIDLQILDKGSTYLFEIVYSNNKIVEYSYDE